MLPNISTDRRTYVATSAVLLIYFILLTVSNLINIAGINKSGMEMMVLPTRILACVMLVFWIVTMFVGPRLRLGILGYIGAAIMIFSCMYAVTLAWGGEYLIQASSMSANGVATLFTFLYAVAAIFEIVAICMFMFSLRTSLSLKIAVPLYVLLAFVLTIFIPMLLGLFTVHVWSTTAVTSVIMLFYTIVVLFPLWFVWRRNARAEMEARFSDYEATNYNF